MSSLSEGDIKAIATAIQGHTQSSSEKLSDNVTKIMVGLCSLGILWMINTIQSVEDNQIRIVAEQKYVVKELDKFGQFMEEPRFSSSDFEDKMQPYQFDVKNIRSELDRRTDTVEQVKTNTADIIIIKNALEELEKSQ